MKKHFVLTLFCASFLLCSGQEHLREYPFTRTAKLQKTPGESASIKFDPCLYKNTNEDYSNLRILDQAGNTVPYAVRVSAPLIKTTEYEKIPGKITHFSIDKTTNSATAEYTLTTDTREIARLSLDTNAKEFNKKESAQVDTHEGDPEAEEITALVLERTQAKKDKDFAKADQIRNDLQARGVIIIDTPNGPIWKRN
jgi:hypothetical protein